MYKSFIFIYVLWLDQNWLKSGKPGRCRWHSGTAQLFSSLYYYTVYTSLPASPALAG